MAAINVDKLNLKELVNLEAKVQSAIVEARSRERAELKRKMADLAETSRLFGIRIVWKRTRRQKASWHSQIRKPGKQV